MQKLFNERGIMKKLIFCAVLLVLSAICFAQRNMTIDNAIYGAGNYIEQKLQRNSIVAIINFSSPSVQLTNYVIDGIIKKIVDDKILRIVDRRNLESIARETRYQLSGDVSDASAKRIGQQLGADSVITGGITQLGNSNMYRLSFQITHIETAEIQGVYYADIPMGSQLNELLPAVAANDPVPQNNTPPARPLSNGDPNYRVYYFRNITQKQYNNLYETFFDEAASQTCYLSAIVQDGGIRDPYIEYSIDNLGVININIAGPYYSVELKFSYNKNNNPGSAGTGDFLSYSLYNDPFSPAKALLSRFNLEKAILEQKYGTTNLSGFFKN
jgi:TolB-like protein